MVLMAILSGCPGSKGSTSGPEATPTPDPTPTVPPNAVVYESLKDGTTTGRAASERGYQFTADGIQFDGVFWYLRYELPETLTSGYVEYKAKGFIPRDHHVDYANHEGFKSRLVSMWNDQLPYGGYVPNMNLFEVKKFGYIQGRPDAEETITFTIQTPGFPPNWGYLPDDSFDTQLAWDPNVTYTIRFEWGGNVVSFYRDGQLLRQNG
jgi:hypothetical protein